MKNKQESDDMDNDYAPSCGVFAHKLNISVGRARVIWAPATETRGAGWVLPGGIRTEHYGDAAAAAMVIDDLLTPRVV
jgi:hypothetical protein